VINMPKFRLNKWYFDCTTAAGDAVIGYSAALRYGFLAFNYGALLIKKAHERAAVQHQSFHAGPITQTPQGIAWRNRALDVRGLWSDGQGSGEVVILDGESGKIQWECLMFNAKADLVCQGESFQGVGYVEKLETTVRPWQFPFQELRWGRFISHDRAQHATWIDLRGSLTRNWIWVNGEQLTGTVGDERVDCGAASLQLQAPQTVRRDDVATMLLGRFHWAGRLLPKGLRKIAENKMIRPGHLLSGGSETDGWSIDEVVLWQ
jgi:hypothetical protein